MRIISRFTGTSLAEADILRRELKDGSVEREDLRSKFMFLAETAGIEAGRADQAWSHVSRFAAYTFCKAHAASYGVLAYASAYLKANFPLEFYAAALRNHAGMYPLWAHVNEARRLGIAVTLPDVNGSQLDFVIQDEAIRTGLNMVKHLARATMDRIIAERDRHPFTSFTDFVGRIAVSREEVASLISSGAFDDIEPARCGILAGYLRLRGRVPAPEQPRLGFTDGDLRLPTREFTALQKRKMEYGSLGFSPLVHPLEFFECPAGSGAQGRVPGGRRFQSASARSDCAIGVLAAIRHYKANGTDLYFLTLDQPAGLRECIVPRRLRSSRLELGQAYAVHGRITERFGVSTLRATAIRNLAEKTV
jgi:DNA polymerase-3 subunit alpha